MNNLVEFVDRPIEAKSSFVMLILVSDSILKNVVYYKNQESEHKKQPYKNDFIDDSKPTWFACK